MESEYFKTRYEVMNLTSILNSKVETYNLKQDIIVEINNRLHSLSERSPNNLILKRRKRRRLGSCESLKCRLNWIEADNSSTRMLNNGKFQNEKVLVSDLAIDEYLSCVILLDENNSLDQSVLKVFDAQFHFDYQCTLFVVFTKNWYSLVRKLQFIIKEQMSSILHNRDLMYKADNFKFESMFLIGIEYNEKGIEVNKFYSFKEILKF